MNAIKVEVPGSKSITQRALVTAALAKGTSRLIGPLESEDTLLLRAALERLGIEIEENGNAWQVQGTGGRLKPPEDSTIFMGNNGTGIRFMASLLCLLDKGHEIELTGSKRMQERPIEPLLSALRLWGADVESIHGTGCPPVRIRPKDLSGGETQVDASKSSQFLSSLLLVAPYTKRPSLIRLTGPIASSPYLSITLHVMKAFGVDVEKEGQGFRVPKCCYRAREYLIEGDASSASYFFAASAVTGKEVVVQNLPADSIQGDARFVEVLEQMGCTVDRTPKGTKCKGPGAGRLKAITIDMGKMPDMVPTLAVCAAMAKGRTVITGCPHLRIKETDRLRAVATELARIGCKVEELEDGLVIEGACDPRPALIHTYDDHRIAMSFAVAALIEPRIKIEDPGCVKKSFPNFWSLWEVFQG